MRNKPKRSIFYCQGCGRTTQEQNCTCRPKPAPVCGCKIVDTSKDVTTFAFHRIEYCPLHAAAPELLEYLKRANATLTLLGSKLAFEIADVIAAAERKV